MSPTSPGAAFREQAALEVRVSAALTSQTRTYLAAVEALALRERAYVTPAGIGALWDEFMGAAALSARLGEVAGAHVAARQSLSTLPADTYDLVMQVFTTANAETWGVDLTDGVLSMALRYEQPLTAASGRAATTAAFDLAFETGRIRWPERVATDSQTSATGLQGTLALAEAREDGYGYKQWVTRRDSKVRDTHAAADGQRVPVGEEFVVGGAELDYPGDMFGPAGETINCRCVTVSARTPAGGRTALPFLSP